MTRLAGKTVLVVGDDPILAARTAEMLVDGGADVVGPAHGRAEALRLIAIERPDVCVLDLHLEDRLTFAIAEAVERAGGLAIFVTSHGVAPGPELGETPLLGKPYDRKTLLKTVATALAAARVDAPQPAPVG